MKGTGKISAKQEKLIALLLAERTIEGACQKANVAVTTYWRWMQDEGFISEYRKVRRGMLGINIQNLTDDTAKAMELKDTAGVLVSNVKAGSAADKAGIKRGDVIMEINRQAVATVESVQSALEKSGDRPILLLVSRRGTTSFLTVRPQ